MNMEEIMEAFEDLLYDLHHTMPAEGEPLRAVWEATIERVEFAMRKMKEAGEGSGP